MWTKIITLRLCSSSVVCNLFVFYSFSLTQWICFIFSFGNPQRQLNAQKMSSVFVCGAFIFQQLFLLMIFYLGVPYKVLCMSYVIYFVWLLTLPRYKGVNEFLFYFQFWYGVFFGFLIKFLVCFFFKQELTETNTQTDNFILL